MIKLVAEGNLDAETHEEYEKPLVIPLDTVHRIVPKIDVWVIELNDGKTSYSTEGCIPLTFRNQKDVPCTAMLMPDMDSGFYDESDVKDGKPYAEFDVVEIAKIYLHDYCEFSVRLKGEPESGPGCPASYLQEGLEIRFRFD